MPDYAAGKIYKIESSKTDEIYVGSTCDPLKKRFSGHRNTYNKWVKTNGTSGYYKSFEILKYQDAIITLVEDFPCQTGKELLDRETYYMRTLKGVINTRGLKTKKEKQQSLHKWQTTYATKHPEMRSITNQVNSFNRFKEKVKLDQNYGDEETNNLMKRRLILTQLLNDVDKKIVDKMELSMK